MKALLFVLAIAATLTSTNSAEASFELLNKNKAIACYGADDNAFVLSYDQFSMEHISQGESSGAEVVMQSTTDRKTFASFETSVGVLTLTNDGDYFQFNGMDEASLVECELE